MLDRLCIFLLDTPLRALLAAFSVAIAGGAVGWWLASPKIRAAWTRVAERATMGGQHAYRAPQSRTELQRPPLLVRATALASYALYPGLAGGFLLVAEELVRTGARPPLLSASLLGLGVVLAHGTHVLVTRGDAGSRTARRRTAISAMVALVAHGALVLMLALVAAGRFDEQCFEVHGIKGATTIMTLGEIRQALPRMPILLSLEGHLLPTWQALACWALVHACGVFVHAALVLSLLWTTRDRPAKSAAAPLPPDAPTRAGWSRLGWLLSMGAVAGAGLAGAAARVVPGRVATGVYESIRRPCSLPELPGGAWGVDSKQHVDFLWEQAVVQFRAPDPDLYTVSLRAAGYEETRPARRPPAFSPAFWPEPEPSPATRHYHLSKTFGSEPDRGDAATICDVHVDAADRLVTVWMWAGD
jgi:hypothetical protein